MRLSTRVVAAILAVGATSCSSAEPDTGGAAPAAAVQEGDAAFIARDLAFSSVPQEVTAGQVGVVLTNEGGLEHDVTFEGVADDAAIAYAAAGETARGTVELQPGAYTYYCSIPGHRQAGMEGTLTAR